MGKLLGYNIATVFFALYHNIQYYIRLYILILEQH